MKTGPRAALGWVLLMLAGCQASNASVRTEEDGVTRAFAGTAMLSDTASGPRLAFDHVDQGEPNVADDEVRVLIAVDLSELPVVSDDGADLRIAGDILYSQTHPSGGTFAPDGTWAFTPGEGHDARILGVEVYWGGYRDAWPDYRAPTTGFLHLSHADASGARGQLVLDIEGRVPYRSMEPFRLTLDFDVAR